MRRTTTQMNVIELQPQASAPACTAFSASARLILGCLEILAEPTIDALVEVTGLSPGEVKRSLGEIRAFGSPAAVRA
jgi:hypothetical protein